MTPQPLASPIFSPHQAKYFAWWLTRKAPADIAVSRTLATAQVDMNPHQVEAALFALRSPLSHGVLLADEVGLGKTVEAGLVLAQYWAADRRRLLLVVPATLRKQWQQELIEKFGLPSIILDAASYKARVKSGIATPFAEEAIVIVSYEFAATKAPDLKAIDWHLAVMDEAHKLRGLHKGEAAKRAWTLAQSLAGHRKLLLTATPFQNSLLELYGLVYFIDPDFFGSKEAFQIQYAGPRPTDDKLRELKHRLTPIAHRTLRRQVKEEGGIDFKRRHSITQDFTPSAEEWELYLKVSEYLQDDGILSIKPGARHLVTLVIRKILASSSFAIANTLQTMIRSLEAKQQIAEKALAADFETADTLADEMDEGDDAETSPQQQEMLGYKAELEQLKAYHKLAAQITRNAKSEALLIALKNAFEMARRFGAQRKAVIFTESVRTQNHLKTWLEENGYAGQIVLLNGSNGDPDSRALLADWQQRHHGSPLISGSRTADMKAAIVEEFRDRRQILISTEAGGEGINLQFCSLLINYDLPWNPQRVEQRIGRVHRYGQKFDVVVVNFVNRKNRADQLVFDLLSKKFQLFDGVFGASDEILGAVESGMDIERRILEVYQRCRTTEQIEAEFKELQLKLDLDIKARDDKAREALLANMDQKVIPILKSRRGELVRQRSAYEEQLVRLLRALYPDARTEADLVLADGQRYALTAAAANVHNAILFDPEQDGGRHGIEQARSAATPDGVLELHYGRKDHEGQLANVQPYIGQSGRLNLSVLRVGTQSGGDTIEHLIVTAVNAAGEPLPGDAPERLLQLPGQWQEDLIGHADLDAPLNSYIGAQINRVVEDARQLAEKLFNEETDRLDRWADDQRLTLRQQVDKLDELIKFAKRELRELPTLEAKAEAKRKVRTLELRRDEAMQLYYEERAKIVRQEDAMLGRIENALKLKTEHQTLFTVNWTLKS